jgi:hypothetical protein
MRGAKRAAAVAQVAVAGALVAAGTLVAGRAAAGPDPRAAPAVTAPVFDSDAPDPDVIRSGGVYYAYTTNGRGQHVPVLTSPNLASWSALGDALPSPARWAVPGLGHTWSPGVAQFGGTFVMYYTAEVAATHDLCLSVATSAVPAGPFTDTSSGPLVCQSDLGGSIDPQPFVDADGTPYLYWKSNSGRLPVPASIWAARLTADGLALASTPQHVLAQDQGWEATVESPYMVHTSGEYVLFYSGGLWNGAGYGVGYALCLGAFGPCTKPQSAPILHSDALRLGPGGQSLVTDAFGNWWMAYAAWDGPASHYSYSSGEFRSLWTAPVTFAGGAPQVQAGEAPEGYRMVGSDGGVFSFGSAAFFGSMGGRPLAAPVVADAGDASTGGYWEVATDGGVFAFGAPFLGSMGGTRLARPVVGMAATPDGGGYWLVASDGGIFAFGDAAFYGSMGGTRLARPVVGMAAMPQGGGYWLVGADGGIFNFGNAQYLGSMGSTPLNRPIVAVLPGPGGGGYWLVASDGGVFSFGDGAFQGSMGAVRLAAPVVGASPT